ncbi:Gfo/Idh/MocA family protein [Rubripirellula reticaptiva]|uniref:Inositol 2-dehydrogenase n=1 Tax=Rubripirellula reticaptiva TaxID=2528013 RepID=A0A5C6F4W1_9BACT|nr:Gfo/Idh/MocA family oxidoreductase [Rubripirellula reticaptiva]TWU55096.1 Inositol 2-dehydrogenase [Rubripirellula reticaptiva]
MIDLNRRNFLATSSATALAASLPQTRLLASPNDRMKVGFIGVGGRGRRNLETIAATGAVDVAAICDVHDHFLMGAAITHPGAAKFTDFRRLYDSLGDQLDAVVVSTTEHTHAYATMPALKLGKHVYCEKPLAYNIDEVRRVTEAATKAGVVTQMGTQIHAGDNFRRVVELVRSGVIGSVSEVHVWVDRAWGLQSKDDSQRNDDPIFVRQRPNERLPVPKHLDWDLWLGPAPQRPYHPIYTGSTNWYRWWDFGNGTMSDLGSHFNDLPFWALRLDAPKTIEAFGPPPHPEIAPATMRAVYQYEARGDRGPVELNWYQGAVKPDLWNAGEIPHWKSGILFVGSTGMILSDYSKHMLLPENEFAEFVAPEPTIASSIGHHEEWVAACRGEGTTGSPFSYAGPLTEANHLGNVAYRVGKKITWDARNIRCVDCPEADQFIRREPRDGWSL